MANRWLNLVFERSPSTGSARVVMLVLADLANDDGRAWPSQETIAKRARLKPRQVRTLLGKLVEAGELGLVRPGGGVLPGGERGLTAVYQLKVAADAQASPDDRPKRAGFQTGNQWGRKRGTGVPGSGGSERGTGGSERGTGGSERGTGGSERGTGGSGTWHARAYNPSETPQRPLSDSEDEKEVFAEGAEGHQAKRDPDVLLKLLPPNLRTSNGVRLFKQNPEFVIGEMLAYAGIDESFRNTITTAGIPLRVLRDALVKMHSKRSPLRKPGAYLRTLLREAGYDLGGKSLASAMRKNFGDSNAVAD